MEEGEVGNTPLRQKDGPPIKYGADSLPLDLFCCSVLVYFIIGVRNKIARYRTICYSSPDVLP